MHPVLIYAVVFIVTIIGLLFLLDKYQFGSFYIVLFITGIITAIIGKIIISIFPLDDPMLEEIEKEGQKQRANQYTREIQYLFNIVQPDPKLQPNPKRVSECLEECFDLDADIMFARLKQHFGEAFDIKTNLPLPDMVEEIKKNYYDWPKS